MPFKSKKQEKYMWANHPSIAKRWEHEYGSYGKKRPKTGKSARRRGAARGR